MVFQPENLATYWQLLGEPQIPFWHPWQIAKKQRFYHLTVFNTNEPLIQCPWIVQTSIHYKQIWDYFLNYLIYSNRGWPQIEANSNTSQNVRASPGGLNDPIFEISSKMGCLGQNWLTAKSFLLHLLCSSKLL